MIRFTRYCPPASGLPADVWINPLHVTHVTAERGGYSCIHLSNGVSVEVTQRASALAHELQIAVGQAAIGAGETEK